MIELQKEYLTVLAAVSQMAVVEQAGQKDLANQTCLAAFPSVAYYLNGHVPMTAPTKRVALDQIHQRYQTACVALRSHFHVAADATG